ncbi:MAG: glycosyltransferase [Proteobacteria bacterium]|nr:glycosyltransferase [Pseudomonadota bacterium]
MFSVVIPTRNRPAYLPEAVASVLAQRDSELELIIVNDGDGPIQLPGDPRLRVIENGARGAVPARNAGVTAASGDVIAFLDDDDVWIDEHHLASAAAEFSAGADFTFGNGIMRFPGEAAPRIFDHGASAETLAQDNTILISAVCYRRSLHERLGAFDEALPFYWDWDWYLRVARAGAPLAHVRRNVVDIRIHAQNMSGMGNFEARQANLDAFAAKHGLGRLVLKNHTDFV